MQPRREFFFLYPNIANCRKGGSHRKKMSNKRQNQSCRPSPVVWEKHRSEWWMRLGSWCFRPPFFSRNWGAVLFKIWNFGVQIWGTWRQNQIMLSSNVPHACPPPQVLEDNIFKIPSQPFSFCTFPDWIKNKKMVSFLLGRTVRQKVSKKSGNADASGWL